MVANYHSESLRAELKARLAKNSQYSLRSFARDLGVSVSWLSDFLKDKKGMSLPAAKKISKALGLSPQETELFVLSAEAHHARSAVAKKKAASALGKIKVTSQFKMKDADFVEAGSWRHQALLELTELKDFDPSVKWIAQRLGVPVATVRSDLEDLQKLGMIKVHKDKISVMYQETSTGNDKASSALRAYHTQILSKAKEVLYAQSVHEREFQSVTFAFESARMDEAKEFIREFQKAFTDKFYQAEAEKDSVHQLSLQFFRLDQRGAK